MAKTPWKEI